MPLTQRPLLRAPGAREEDGQDEQPRVRLSPV
jgi:hypothetical protein